MKMLDDNQHGAKGKFTITHTLGTLNDDICNKITEYGVFYSLIEHPILPSPNIRNHFHRDREGVTAWTSTLMKSPNTSVNWSNKMGSASLSLQCTSSFTLGQLLESIGGIPISTSKHIQVN